MTKAAPAHSRYVTGGAASKFEPGSRGRVLRNRLGIRRVADMEEAESDALLDVQDWAIRNFDAHYRFRASDVRELHRRWLGRIYDWAGEYRTVNISKAGFMFAAARQIPELMAKFSRRDLARDTPCANMDYPRLATALARTHAELILIHPFREGNGRCARLLAYLMALQAGLPSLDSSVFASRGKHGYVSAIHAALCGNHEPLQKRFVRSIRRTISSWER